MSEINLLLGDCLQSMRAMPDNSVDSIVTDPPYGLKFMGKKWDCDVPSVDIWTECLQVLKPGGHLLAFAGTRTQHRMAVRIEDAGFEIRDMIACVYGSGFPKSMDVSKAIDKAGGDPLAFKRFAASYRAAVEQSGMTHADIDRRIGIASAGSNSCYWARDDHRGGLPPRHHWEKVRDLLSLSPGIEQMYDEAEREVVATDRRKNSPSGIVSAGRESVDVVREITVASSDAAIKWNGWGTALKPALEPITVARKPLIGTVAANVLMHGTGAINVNACRVEPTGESRERSGEASQGQRYVEQGGTNFAATPGVRGGDPSGRWPANLIHDGSEEVVALFPESKSGGYPAEGGQRSQVSTYGKPTARGEQKFTSSEGSAARFFYCAKTSRKDRNDGIIDPGPQFKQGTTLRNVENATTTGNNHPTVKPTELMAYLCRLVTPLGGTVLDPFMGSGSTGKAAVRESLGFIGCEISAEYLAIAKSRIEFEQSRMVAAVVMPVPQIELFEAIA